MKEQGSEAASPRVLFFVILSGGLQDAYTYFGRGGVFANAQTGNVIFCSVALFHGEYAAFFRYLLPIAAFFAGVLTAEWLRRRWKAERRLFWQQHVLLLQCAVLACVAALPRTLDGAANALVSFACATQVQGFRHYREQPFASTMCIGNLVQAAAAFSAAVAERDSTAARRGAMYLYVVALFGLGAGMGYLAQRYYGRWAILFSVLLLLAAFLVLLLRQRERNTGKEAPGAPGGYE